MIATLALFWAPALARTGFVAFAPLDDVYIYFDFARSTARGHLLAWGDDTGFSTGATSPLYALLLAPFWALGARGDALHLGAAAIAVGSLYVLGAATQKLAGARATTRWIALGLLLGIPLCAWSFASGMEAAFVAAAIALAVVRVGASAACSADRRDRAQRKAGLALGVLALARPECVPLALLLAVALAHAAGTRSLLRALARGLFPPLAALGVVTLAARATTGEWAFAGALRKVVLYDPHATSEDVLVLALTQAIRLWTEGFELGLGSPWAARALLLLALLGASARRTRRLGLPLVLGAVAAFALVSLNRTAPFQNLRYLVPSFVMLLLAATLGLSELAKKGRSLRLAGELCALALLASSWRNLPWQVQHFARAAKNIHEQQAEVGRRLAKLDPPLQRVFVGDAGAIPYFADRPALDGLGLGGYRDLPFARASVEGVGAVVELIERMPARERPDVLAIYDGWWPGLAQAFGAPLFSVRIDDNVICADPEKRVYRADWSALEDRQALTATAIDRLDVADLVEERAHALTLSEPRAGRVSLIGHKRGGALRYDAVRALGEGQSLRFTLRLRDGSKHARALRLVTDSDPDALLELTRDAVREEHVTPLASAEAWQEATLPLAEDAPEIATFTLRATRGVVRIGSITAE